jgi:hypothetical protein
MLSGCHELFRPVAHNRKQNCRGSEALLSAGIRGVEVLGDSHQLIGDPEELRFHAYKRVISPSKTYDFKIPKASSLHAQREVPAQSCTETALCPSH